MSDSESSALSSAPSVEDESIVPTRGKDGMLQFLSTARLSSPTAEDEERPTQRKRAASPPHEYVLADNPDIAVGNFDAGGALNHVLPMRLGATAAVPGLWWLT